MAVYVGARDLAGSMAFIGTHQFLVIAPDSGKAPPAILPDGKTVFPKNLGNSKSGFVIGAQNRGRLIVEFFEKSDYQATLEHFNPDKYRKWYKTDLDAELIQVKHNSNDMAFIAKILFLINNYIINERDDNIPYPFSGLAVNSNSWAQSVILAANGKVASDFKGLDISNNKRIPAIYFQAVCPAIPRPKVNQ
jgi:hypothetical protein